jgi:hypothetical protein
MLCLLWERLTDNGAHYIPVLNLLRHLTLRSGVRRARWPRHLEAALGEG